MLQIFRDLATEKTGDILVDQVRAIPSSSQYLNAVVQRNFGRTHSDIVSSHAGHDCNFDALSPQPPAAQL